MGILSFSKVIARSALSRPATRLYPFVKREAFANARGHIEIDISSCIFCSLCARKCPTDAITVAKTEKLWTIDRLRCCCCNACVEVCPKKCLSMRVDYTPVVTERALDSFKAPVAPDAAADRQPKPPA